MTGAGRSAWAAWVDEACDDVEAAGRWRAPRSFDARDHEGPLVTGSTARPVVSFASNDYLGLSNHPAVVAAAHAALDRWGAGAGASRLVTGSRPVHHDLEAALAALGVVRSEQGAELRGRLRGLIDRVADGIGAPDHPSPILPIVIGAEDDALAASAALLESGLWVPAIRPPTVAAGTSRLRITLSATHSDDQVDRLLVGLASAVPDAGRGVGSAA